MALDLFNDDWRRPGCDQRCQLRTVIAPGLTGRLTSPIHDPDAHEEYATQRATGATDLIVQSSALVVNLTARAVWVEGRQVQPSLREWGLLALLAEAQGGWRSRLECFQAVYWDWPPPTSQGEAHSLHIVVARLRHRLGPAGSLVTTRPAFGYRLTILPAAERCDTERGPWARHWPCCQRCGGTEHPHEGRGLCRACRDKGRPR